MTNVQYLVDIAFYQAGLDLRQVEREGFAGVIARASTGYRPSASSPAGGSHDPQYATFRAAARRTGLLFAAYHFLYSSRVRSIEAQADVCASAIGDRTVPVMIDHETADDTGTPSIGDALAFAAAMRRRGYRVPLWYLPHWVWQRLGSPRLPTGTGLALVSSSYVGKGAYASALYSGDGGPGWAPYGGMTPAIWQFTDGARVAGRQVDANAYRGTRDQLAALLSGGADTSKDDDMPIRTSLSLGTPAPLVWGDETVLRWAIESTDPKHQHANGHYPGFVADHDAYVDLDVLLRVDGLAKLDTVQTAMIDHTWKDGRSVASRREIIDDANATSGDHYVRASGSLYLHEGHHLYITLYVAPDVSGHGAPAPRVVSGTWRVRQDR